MILSILICTLKEKYSEEKLQRLLTRLAPQLTPEVEILINDEGRHMPTGTKRNRLISLARGKYFVFIDCDDLVSEDYVSEILKATESNPDCITFKGWMTTNGDLRENWTIKLGSKYVTENGHHYRWPNHISVMKLERVKHIAFPPIWKQEDYEWSKVIHNKGLLRSEVHIDKELYHYDFWQHKVDPKSISPRRFKRMTK